MGFFPDAPKGEPILSVSSDVIAVNRDVTFTCDTSDLISQPEVNKYIFYNSTSELPIQDFPSWTTRFFSVLNTDQYYCIGKNDVGRGERKSIGKLLIVQGKAHKLQYGLIKPLLTLFRVYLILSFFIQCLSII